MLKLAVDVESVLEGGHLAMCPSKPVLQLSQADPAGKVAKSRSFDPESENGHLGAIPDAQRDTKRHELK